MNRLVLVAAVFGLCQAIFGQRFDEAVPHVSNGDPAHSSVSKETYESSLKVATQTAPANLIGLLDRFESRILKGSAEGKAKLSGKPGGYTFWQFAVVGMLRVPTDLEGVQVRERFFTANGKELDSERVYAQFSTSGISGKKPAMVFYDLYQPPDATEFELTFMIGKSYVTSPRTAFRRPNPSQGGA